MAPNKPRTICVKCKYFIRGTRDAWYDQQCRAVTRPLGIDPVTGRKLYYTQNDLGRTYFGADEHPHCRDVNDDGDCSLYEK